MFRSSTILSPALASLLTLSACSGAGEAEGGEPSVSLTESPPSPPPEASGSAARAGEGARLATEENELYSFEYSYPAQAAAIPELRKWLDGRLDTTRSELEASAKEFKRETEREGFPYRAYSSVTDWRVVADLPDWLSLSADLYSYTGGAHGMSNFDTLVWDKRAGERRDPVDLFVSPQALSQALRVPFCKALDKERAKRRGGETELGVPEFNQCIDPLEQTIILGSSNHKTFDRIGLLAPPYNAGPYAEGSYEVTLPVTRTVLDAVKPQYRASFSTGR